MAALKNANKKRAIGPFNLPAEFVGADACESVDMRSMDHSVATGEKVVREFTKLINPSLRFAPGELKTALPDAVLKCPEIAAAIQRGELVSV